MRLAVRKKPRPGYLERYDALPLGAPDHAREHLRCHLPHLHILVRKTLQQDVHEFQNTILRDRWKVSIEKHDQSGQRVQPYPPGLRNAVFRWINHHRHLSYHIKRKRTVDDLTASTKLSRIVSMNSTGGVTADKIYRTAELYACSSELSFSSDMRSISGLLRY